MASAPQTPVSVTIPPASVFQGPFPTDFTPASTCTGISVDNIAVLNSATTCLPKSFNTDGYIYYSPGTGCPTGYTAQPRCTRSDGRDAATTTITCCPYRKDLTLACVEDPNTLADDWASMMCTWSAGDKLTVLTVTTELNGNQVSSAFTVTADGGVNAYGLKMVYEATDLPTTRSTGSDRPATSAGKPDSDNNGGGGGGLSTGAKAAIGVVVPVVVIAVLVGFFFLFRRRRNQRVEKPDPNATPELDHDGSKGGPLHYYSGYGAVPREELDAVQPERFEMDAGPRM